MSEQAKLSYEQLLALYDKQEAEKKALVGKLAEAEARNNRQNTVSFKCRAKGEKYTDSQGNEQVGKGNMSMYGLGQRFPVSLYEAGWRTLIQAAKDGTIEKALEANKAKLSQSRD